MLKGDCGVSKKVAFLTIIDLAVVCVVMVQPASAWRILVYQDLYQNSDRMSEYAVHTLPYRPSITYLLSFPKT